MTSPTESGYNCGSAGGDTVQIEIVPQRILNPETSEKLLRRVYDCDGIIRVQVQGSRLPDKVGYGPGTGEKVNHPLKKSIEVEGQQVNMRVTLSRLLVEVDSDRTADEIKKICDETFSFPFEFYKGVFFKKYSTIVDYAKMGPNPDERLLGMTDPKGKLDQIVYIEKERKDSE
ncbi:MAG: methyl-coenzyme M reductase operon protein D [Methanosarcinales archaeon]|jgi:methyl-coenzyme M reductase subunit D|nr:methyl-coenzyme M reductase operon protein D [Methanosarcinales archaeon]